MFNLINRCSQSPQPVKPNLAWANRLIPTDNLIVDFTRVPTVSGNGDFTDKHQSQSSDLLSEVVCCSVPTRVPERLGGSRGVPDRPPQTSHHANQGSYCSLSSQCPIPTTKLVIIYPGCGDFCGGTFCKVVPLNLLHAAMSTKHKHRSSTRTDGRIP